MLSMVMRAMKSEERDGFLLRRELRDRMVALKGLLLQEETEYR